MTLSYRTINDSDSPTVVGEIVYIGQGITPLANYLLCDGSVVSQATYPELFANIGLITNGTLISSWSQTFGAGRLSSPSYYLFFDNKYVTIGTGGVATSTNAVNWTRTRSWNGTLGGIQIGSELYAYVGGTQAYFTSTDATSWTSRTSNVLLGYYVSYGNSVYVTSGSNGYLASSTNGISWTTRTTGTTVDSTSLMYGNSIFANAGTNYFATSTNGINWTNRTPTITTATSYVYGNGLFLTYGSNVNSPPTIKTSTNGVNWITRTSSLATVSNAALCYGDSLFVALADSNVIETSTNGISWKSYSSLNTVTNGSARGIVYTTNRYYITVYNNAGPSEVYYYATKYTYDYTTNFILPTINTSSTSGLVKGSLYIRAST